VPTAAPLRVIRSRPSTCAANPKSTSFTVERLADGREPLDRLVQSDRERSLHDGAERLAEEQLHHEVGAEGRIHVMIDDADDVGVIDGGRGAGLALEAGDHLRSEQARIAEQLQREAAAEPDVLDLPHAPHPACTQRADQLVALGDPLPRRGPAHVAIVRRHRRASFSG